MKNLRSEAPALYAMPPPVQPDDVVIQRALAILEARINKNPALSSPRDTIDYLRLQLVPEQREVFGVLYLDNRYRAIGFEPLFYGTIDGASVHPREVVKAALLRNAAAVILAHNHPSGSPEPSRADQNITKRLQDALALVDVRVLDHVVVGAEGAVSFAERGLL
jgi:DNA repair protein RadC